MAANHQNGGSLTFTGPVSIVAVPFPAHGHLNQLLHLSCFFSSAGLPVHFASTATHNRQARLRATSLNFDKIHFHDLPHPHFQSPPPNPTAAIKFPAHLQPSFEAALHLRQPLAALLREISTVSRRVIVIHDPLMSSVAQEAASILNAETYVFSCLSVLFQLAHLCENKFQAELPANLPTMDGCLTPEFMEFSASQFQLLGTEEGKFRAGYLYNSCKLIEGRYIDLLSSYDQYQDKKIWAIGPILPVKSVTKTSNWSHKSIEWLDKQEPRSVIYVSFGTMTSISDEQIRELAVGLEQSKQRFIWVLREADRADIFSGEEQRKVELPEGFEERVKGIGMVVRDWAPQPEILGHRSTGGFMTHCGWNSSLESVTMGVPVAAWPMHSDQPRNAVLLTEVLKVGVPVREWTGKGEIVGSSEIEEAVRRLMASEEGEEIRKRAEELGGEIRRSTAEGGVCRVELDSFVAHITRN